MKKRKNSMKISILLIGIVFTLIKCEKADDSFNIRQQNQSLDFNTPTISATKNNFEKNKNKTFNKNIYSKSSTENTSIFIDWDNSKEMNFKKKEKINILYTPILFDKKENRMKSFIASVDNKGKIESIIFTLVYDEFANKNQFSGLIFKHNIEGEFLKVYRYLNGHQQYQGSLNQNNSDSNKSSSHRYTDVDPISVDCTEQLSAEDIEWMAEVGWDLANILDCVTISGSNGNSLTPEDYENLWNDIDLDLYHELENLSNNITNTSSSGSNSNDIVDTLPSTTEPVNWWEEETRDLSIQIQAIKSKLTNLSLAQTKWLENQNNSTEIFNIYKFLYFNNSNEAIQFAYLAIDTFLVNGIVDYGQRIIIDPSFKNNDKANCTYEKLKEAGGIKQILEDFFDTDKTANLIIKLEPNLTCNDNSNPFGCTSFNKSTQTATISIDENFITQFQWNGSGGIYQTPMLNIAKVIIHEAIHAQLFYNAYQVDINTELSDKTFEDLYEEYRKLEGWQHKYMADYYISIISSALEEVHPLLNDQGYINYINNNYPDWTWQQIYENMAWSGLTQTPAGKEYLSNTNNANLYSLQNTDVASNSNKTPNCQQ